MYDDVLVPTDGSAGTNRVVEHALAASGPETALHALYVVDRRHVMAADDDAKEEVRRSLETEGDRALGEVRTAVREAGHDCTVAREEGIPARAILDYAAAEGVDLVVMGTHGRTGRESVAALGSTTDRVVEDGSVPVLVATLD